MLGWQEGKDDDREDVEDEHGSVDKSDLQVRVLDAVSVGCVQQEAEHDQGYSSEEHAGVTDGSLDSSVRLDGPTGRVLREVLTFPVVVD